MGLKEWIIPQDHKFFNKLDAISDNAVDAAEALDDLLEDYTDLEAKRKRIEDHENIGDDLVHDLYELLNRSFITPIDHGDMALLMSGLDDFVDYIEAATVRLYLYDIEEPTEGMQNLGSLIKSQSYEVQKAVAGLRDLHEPDDIEKALIEIHTFENAADDIFNQAIANLIRTQDPKTIITRKEILEHLETATDKAEETANIIGDIVMKNA